MSIEEGGEGGGDHTKNHATKNPIKKNDNKCFQYAATLALNHEETGKDSGRNNKNLTFYR